MTASARCVDPADHSPCSRPQAPDDVGRDQLLLRRFTGTVFVACVLVGRLVIAREPTSIENIGLPSSATEGAFDDGGRDMTSVLVNDGQDQDFGRHPGYEGILEQDAIQMETPGSAPGIGLESACPSSDFEWEDGCKNGCHGGRRWVIQAGALVLWRDDIAGQPLLIDNFGEPALDAGDVRTAAAAGPRIGVIRSLGCGRAIEGNYFNVGGIQGTTRTNGAGLPYTPIGLADILFTDIDEAQYATRGQIKSAELNYRWCQGRRVIWLAGFRWVEWNEVALVEMQPSGDNIRTNAGNDLYGGQFGCRLRLWNLGKWQVGAVGKAGVFGNVAYQRTTAIVDQEGFGPIGAAADDVAFFGEAGVNSTLWLTRWLAWRAGYNFFWLEGVATAARQFPLGNFGSETAAINTNGSVFLQGFSTGLEARW